MTSPPGTLRTGAVMALSTRKLFALGVLPPLGSLQGPDFPAREKELGGITRRTLDTAHCTVVYTLHQLPQGFKGRQKPALLLGVAVYGQ